VPQCVVAPHYSGSQDVEPRGTYGW